MHHQNESLESSNTYVKTAIVLNCHIWSIHNVLALLLYDILHVDFLDFTREDGEQKCNDEYLQSIGFNIKGVNVKFRSEHNESFCEFTHKCEAIANDCFESPYLAYTPLQSLFVTIHFSEIRGAGDIVNRRRLKLYNEQTCDVIFPKKAEAIRLRLFTSTLNSGHECLIFFWTTTAYFVFLRYSKVLNAVGKDKTKRKCTARC